MRIDDLPSLRILAPGGSVVVRPETITMLRASHKLVEVFTGAGSVGWLSRASVQGLVERYPGDWVMLSHSAAVKRSAILRIDHLCTKRGLRRYAARVAGVRDQVPISRRHRRVVWESLGWGKHGNIDHSTAPGGVGADEHPS